MSQKKSYKRKELKGMRKRARILLDYYTNPSEAHAGHWDCPLCYENNGYERCRQCEWNYGKANEMSRCMEYSQNYHTPDLRRSLAIKYDDITTGVSNRWCNKRIKELTKFIEEVTERISA